jgi:hypothetical protein
MKVSQTLYTTSYKPTIEKHDGLIMIANVLNLLSCIYVQKYDCMDDNYFLCLFDRVFTLTLVALPFSFKISMLHNFHHEFYVGKNLIVGVFIQVAQKLQT